MRASDAGVPRTRPRVGRPGADPGLELDEQLPLRIVFLAGLLLPDHLALALDLDRLVRRVEEGVSEELERPPGVLLGHGRDIGRRLEGGGGVQVAAELLHDAVHLPAPMALAALEEHVLEEMGDAAQVRRLVRGTGAAADRNRRHPGMRHLAHDEHDAPRQGAFVERGEARGSGAADGFESGHTVAQSLRGAAGRVTARTQTTVGSAASSSSPAGGSAESIPITVSASSPRSPRRPHVRWLMFT